jgi:hypothetical protein
MSGVSQLNQPILEGDEEILDLSSAVGRSKMVVIGFWLLLRARPQDIPCLLVIDRQPSGVNGVQSIPIRPVKDPLKAVYFRRESHQFSRYVERDINGVPQLNQLI